ncbi:hypothetical protein D9M68_1003640 [compost metagenome]
MVQFQRLPLPLALLLRQLMQPEGGVQAPAVTISQAWHPRFNEDPAHRAIRQMVHRISLAISGR